MDYKVMSLYRGATQRNVSFISLSRCFDYIAASLLGETELPHQIVIEFKNVEYLLITLVNPQIVNHKTKGK